VGHKVAGVKMFNADFAADGVDPSSNSSVEAEPGTNT
jgi:hypothetical protein